MCGIVVKFYALWDSDNRVNVDMSRALLINIRIFSLVCLVPGINCDVFRKGVITVLRIE